MIGATMPDFIPWGYG